MILLGALVFVLDAITVYLSQLDREVWLVGNERAQLTMEGLTATAVNVSVLMIAHYSWWMVPPSVLGAVAGRWLAGRTSWPMATPT